MKEFIVILATIALGVTLAGFVMGYGESATDFNDDITGQLDSVFSTEPAAPGGGGTE